MYKNFQLIAIPILFFLTSCGSSSLDEYRDEGTAKARAIILELRDIQTREALMSNLTRLKKRFNDLVDVMIEARVFAEKHPELEEAEYSSYSYLVNTRLREELERIYQIDGGREIVEKAQQEALHRLDMFEQRLQSKKLR